MALGGGVWITQNKVIPGAYINFVNASKATATLGERGYAAIALPLPEANVGKVIEVTAADFIQRPEEVLGDGVEKTTMFALNEMFKHATTVYVYGMGDSTDVSDALVALEPYDFNCLAAYTNTSSDVEKYVSMIKVWRDTYGKKCTLVAYTEDADYEGVINVTTAATEDSANGIPAYALVAWVAGAQAGCAVNASCTNMIYDGNCEIATTLSQSGLEAAIEGGEFVFHMVYGKMRVLEDINSLVTTDVNKGEDFKSNQTMRVCDQIANDIAKMWNVKYLGKIPNDDAGRTSLWADIVKHHQELQKIRAIQNFDATQVTVVQGDTKKAVVVNDIVNPVNAMSHLYMTVVVQ